MKNYATATALEKLFIRKRLGKYYASIGPLTRECIYLKLKLAEQADISVGSSRIGGWPDLPGNAEWFYTKEGTPLSFLGQVHLGELKNFLPQGLTSPGGWLYFFYDTEDYPPGFDPEDKSGHRVYHFSGDVRVLKRQEFPSKEVRDRASVYETATVTFSRGLSVPVDFNLIPEDDDSRRYIEEIANPEIEINKMFGYPNALQDDMQLQCELVTNGIDCGDESALERSDIAAFHERAQDWILLLQLDSNDDTDMHWEESGRLFFWIKKDDFIHGRFDRSWAILQSS